MSALLCWAGQAGPALCCCCGLLLLVVVVVMLRCLLLLLLLLLLPRLPVPHPAPPHSPARPAARCCW